MKKLTSMAMLMLTVVLFSAIYSLAYEDTYVYKSVCPGGKAVFPEDYYKKVYKDKIVIDEYWVDKWGFAQCNCTSYVSNKLNERGVYFNNGYKEVKWGNGGLWDNAASTVNIPYDSFPLPGDVAYWNSLSQYGHVAWVERVYFDDKDNIVSVDITEYNFHSGEFSSRNLKVENEEYPDGFIHILAYNEGVTSLFYMDNYEMSSLSSINQTEKEWKWILPKVNNYRCRTCSGNYRYVADVFYTDYGMGGGDAGDDGTSLNGPDGNIKEVKVSLDGVNYVRSLQVKPGQKLQGRVKVTNKGDETIDYFEVFFLSST